MDRNPTEIFTEFFHMANAGGRILTTHAPAAAGGIESVLRDMAEHVSEPGDRQE